jgi:peptidoglycan/xylan/chitin deacetylase (PgdA/CDA1 family)
MSLASGICDKMKSLPPAERNRILSGLLERFGKSERPDSSHTGASWSQIRSSFPVMQAGAHTRNHEILANLGPDEARDEITGSKRIIEEKTGRPVRYFAYPNGRREDFRTETERIVSESGFGAAMTTIEGFNCKGDDLYELKRQGVGSDTGMLWFRMAVTGTIDLLKRMETES